MRLTWAGQLHMDHVETMQRNNYRQLTMVYWIVCRYLKQCVCAMCDPDPVFLPEPVPLGMCMGTVSGLCNKTLEILICVSPQSICLPVTERTGHLSYPSDSPTGCTPLLMTYFTEKNHNIWDRGEARGRLLLAKIVGCYIPCSLNLHLMTYFTEKNHNIWDRGEARGRLLLAKIVGCYIPCSLNLHLMTYFTEKNHNIWDRGEARGRLLLAKIVGCYIPCSLNLYGCKNYIYCRHDFSVTFVLVWVRNKNNVIFMKFQNVVSNSAT